MIIFIWTPSQKYPRRVSLGIPGSLCTGEALHSSRRHGLSPTCTYSPSLESLPLLVLQQLISEDGVFRAETFFLLSFNHCSFFDRIQDLMLSFSCIKPVTRVWRPLPLSPLPALHLLLQPHNFVSCGTTLTPVGLLASCFFYLEFSSLSSGKTSARPIRQLKLSQKLWPWPLAPREASTQLCEKSSFARLSCSVDLAS